MIRTYRLLTLTLTFAPFSVFAAPLAIIVPVCRTSEREFSVLLENRPGTLFWDGFRTEEGTDTPDAAVQVLAEKTRNLYNAESIRNISTLRLTNGDVLFLADVDHKTVADPFRWIPLSSVTKNETIVCGARRTHVHTDIRTDLTREKAAFSAGSAAPAAAIAPRAAIASAAAAKAPAPVTTAATETPDTVKAVSTPAPTEARRAPEGPSPIAGLSEDEETAPVPSDARTPMSIPDYLAEHAKTKHIVYNREPVSARATSTKKRCKKHRKKCHRSRCKRRAIALMLHRKHRMKRFYRNIYKNMICSRRFHKKRSSK
jgi:hypothetical protein